jgi:chloride channel protein, CIC family
METKPLEISGEILMHNKEQQILNSIDVNEMLQDHAQTIAGDRPVFDLVNLFAQSEINVYAVHDKQDVFTGIVDLQDVKKILLNREAVAQLCIIELAKQPEDVIYVYESMATVMEKFGRCNSWFLPVLNDEHKFVAFISRSKLFNKYRQVLSARADLYED